MVTGIWFSLVITRPSFSRGSQAKPTERRRRRRSSENQPELSQSDQSNQTAAQRLTLGLDEVPLLGAGLAVAVTADVVEGEEQVMLLVQLSRKLDLILKRKSTTLFLNDGVNEP